MTMWGRRREPEVSGAHCRTPHRPGEPVFLWMALLKDAKPASRRTCRSKTLFGTRTSRRSCIGAKQCFGGALSATVDEETRFGGTMGKGNPQPRPRYTDGDVIGTRAISRVSVSRSCCRVVLGRFCRALRHVGPLSAESTQSKPPGLRSRSRSSLFPPGGGRRWVGGGAPPRRCWSFPLGRW